MMGPGGMMGGWGPMNPMMAARGPGPGFGHPGGPGGPGGGGEGDAAVKKGLVNDPMANIGPGQSGQGGYGGPGQWGPWGGPGPGGPWGPWGGHGGPRPPGPGGMMCVSQGISGKVCKHFGRGQCTYGNRCIHLHLVPNPAMQQQQPTAGNTEEESDDDEEEEEEGEG